MVKTISVENLSVAYRNKKEKVIAVDNIGFSVNQGEIFSFLGPSRAGITTTQRILTTLLQKLRTGKPTPLALGVG